MAHKLSLLLLKKLTLINFIHGMLFFISMFFILQNLIYQINSQLLHEDEVIFVERGKFFDWYMDLEFNRNEWQSFESYDVPKFAELFYGFLLKIHFNKPVIETLEEKAFFEQNILFAGNWRTDVIRNTCCSLQQTPQYVLDKAEPILVLRKYVIFIFVLPLLILVYLIGKDTYGKTFGLLAMTIIGFNSLFISAMTRVMGDAPLWFFSFLFLYMSFFFNFKKSRHNYLLLATLGIVLGLATSTKLNGALLYFYWILLVGFQSIRKVISGKQMATFIFVIFIFGYATFALLNPFIWPSPINNSIMMVKHRTTTFERQSASNEFAKDSLNGVNTRIAAIYKNVLSPNSNYNNFKFEKWNYIGKLNLDLPLLFLGICMMLFKLLGHSSRQKISLIHFKKVLFLLKGQPSNKVTSLVIFFLAILLPTAMTIPLYWDRYFLPFVFGLSFFQSGVISSLVTTWFTSNKKI